MNLLSLYSRNPWLLSPKTLGITSAMLGGVAVLQWIGGSDVLTASALALLAVGGLGGISYERRLNRRRTLRRMVSCTAPGCHDVPECNTLDISSNGFFVETDRPYQLLTRFRFELVLAEGDAPVAGQGVVRWINWHAPRGMGIEIVRLEDPDRFRRLLSSQLAN